MAADWLILHAGALGDLALTLQLALRLPAVSPASTLHVLSSTDPGDLSKCRPAVCRQSAESFGLHWLHTHGDEAPPARLAEIVAGRLVLNALGPSDGIVHQRLETLGSEAAYSFDPRPRAEQDAHITSQWQGDLEQQGQRLAGQVDRAEAATTLEVPDEMRALGRDRFSGAESGSNPILIHPGSGGRAKCWPLESFLEVARRLGSENLDVCFVAGPVEQETWPPDTLSIIRSEFPLIVCPTSDELLALLAAARMFLSGDCGPAHLAVLVGTPTVTIFGPTSATVWRPLGLNARVVAGGPAAHPDDWGISLECIVSEVMGCVADADRSS